jgi:hypothetical protein
VIRSGESTIEFENYRTAVRDSLTLNIDRAAPAGFGQSSSASLIFDNAGGKLRSGIAGTILIPAAKNATAVR